MIIYKELIDEINTLCDEDLTGSLALFPIDKLQILKDTLPTLSKENRVKCIVRYSLFTPYVVNVDFVPVLVLSANSYVTVVDDHFQLCKPLNTTTSKNSIKDLLEFKFICMDCIDTCKTSKVFYGIFMYKRELFFEFIKMVTGLTGELSTECEVVDYKPAKDRFSRYTLTARNGVLIGEAVRTKQFITVYHYFTGKYYCATEHTYCSIQEQREINRLITIYLAFINGIIIEYTDIYVYGTVDVWHGRPSIVCYGDAIF